MSISKFLWLGILPAVLIVNAAEFPAPVVDTPAAAHKKKETAVLAGGCYWGVEAIFDRVKGISGVESGFAKGDNSGDAGHAESVKITFDPSKISYGQLLEVFFAVAHDPTELNRQGPDVGAEYRSVIFYSNDEQKHVAEAYIEQLNKAGVYPRPIVTAVAPLAKFQAVDESQQHFVDRNPNSPYVVANDLPKLEHLKQQFPDLLKHH
ncbi:MAG TPA: peptide-methionine (S)-S-oxide reductase MsrA [Bryobacteraceae bacterium]|jgi:peptide-methionine (S)-S-oxide reductase|nr:peptide-methionine (S)-S-oxide reductase MsrA [Bryobacteraceae bacterium]